MAERPSARYVIRTWQRRFVARVDRDTGTHCQSGDGDIHEPALRVFDRSSRGVEALEKPGEFHLAALRTRHPGTDTIGSPESHEFDSNRGLVVIGARELADGESLADFTEEASAATRCGPHGSDTTTLDGEAAELRKFECGGTFWHQFTAVHDGRGYLVWGTRPLRDDFLESFAFTD